MHIYLVHIINALSIAAMWADTARAEIYTLHMGLRERYGLPF